MQYEQFSCLPPAGSQERFDAAVIIPTILRPTLVRAMQSVFNQDLGGRIQLLIGIDQRQGDSGRLETAARECPGNVFLSVSTPGIRPRCVMAACIQTALAARCAPF